MKLIHRRKPLGMSFLVLMLAGAVHAEESRKPLTYRQFEVKEADGRVLSMTPVPTESTPRWAWEVSQKHFDWTKQSSEQPFFAKPVPFVLPPTDEGEPFYPHNHQPSITWLPNAPGEGEFDGGAWTKQFTATPTRAEHAGYLAATQTPDGIIHLISSRLQYRFNLPWLVAGSTSAGAEPSEEANR